MVFLDTELDRLDVQAALENVSPQRCRQALQYRHDDGRRQSLAAYLLLCRALRVMYGIDRNPTLVYGSDGKPRLADYPKIHFNLSHCGVAVACVVDDVPVGVDVERVHTVSDSLVTYTMNEQEQAHIRRAMRPDVAFIRLWTQKEAVLKLSGEGITNRLHDVLLMHRNDVEWHTGVSPDAAYVVSVARYKSRPYI